MKTSNSTSNDSNDDSITSVESIFGNGVLIQGLDMLVWTIVRKKINMSHKILLLFIIGMFDPRGSNGILFHMLSIIETLSI